MPGLASTARTAGVDLGLASTAVVLFIGDICVESRTFTTKGNAKVDPYGVTVQRAYDVAGQAADLLREFDAGAIGVELYRDMPVNRGACRRIPLRWTTPMVAMALFAALPGAHLVWQDPQVVMTQYGALKRMWADGVNAAGVDPKLVSNDHERSAAAHALFAIAHTRTGRVS